VAPGSSLVSMMESTSSILLDNPQLQVEKTSISGTTYLKLSGTSMAAAVTTGVVAAMLDASRATFGAEPGLTPNAIKAMLEYSAVMVADHDVLTQGAGGLNGDGALAQSLDPGTPVGEWWLVRPTTETSTISGEELA